METSEIRSHHVRFDKRWLRPTYCSPPGLRLEPVNNPLHFIIVVLAIVVGFLVLLGALTDLMSLPPPIAPEFYSG